MTRPPSRILTPRAAGLAAAVLSFLCAPAVRAEDLEGDLVYLPMPQGESITVDNRLGKVRLRGWDEPQVRIVAHKRADKPGVLDRLKVRVDIHGGRLRITTGVYFGDNVWRPVPLAGAGVDLTIDAPRGMAVDASTWSGELDAAGFRSGARLASQRGEIRAADITGRVDTRTLGGRQSLQGIHGPLEASGIEGDVELESVDGETVDATVYKGQITAREVKTPVVRLRTTYGAIVFVGTLARGGRYELTTLVGDVRMRLCPSPFKVVAHGTRIDTTGFQLVTQQGTPQKPGVLEAEFRGGGASLALTSTDGAVSLLPAANCR